MRLFTIYLISAAMPSAAFSVQRPQLRTPRTTVSSRILRNKYDSVTSLHESESGTETTATSSSASSSSRGLSIPLSWEEMVRQVASAMKEASEKGTSRQIVRVLLPRDSSSDDLGKYIEEGFENSNSKGEIALVPPDESWQGGIMQLYRAAAPTASEIVRTLTSASSLPSRISEDRSVDESGVDGVGLLQTEDQSVNLWVQPTQECVDGMVKMSEQVDANKLVVLLNPQWRQVDDALDAQSKGEGFMSTLASFLGGKGGTLKQLAEAGYQPVYTLEGYVCRGSNVRLLQVLDSPWTVFCERDNQESYIQVGTSEARPTYQQVEVMLQDSDIGYKYARDMGWQEKL